VLGRMIAALPADRPATPAAVAEALIAAAGCDLGVSPAGPVAATTLFRTSSVLIAPESLPPPPPRKKPPPTPGRWRKFALWGTAAALLLGVGTWLGVWALSGRTPESSTKPPAPPPPVTIPPLDQLSARKLLPSERYPGQPAEVVAVLGDQHWRQWSGVRLLATSPTGGQVASGGDGDVVYLWNPTTGFPHHLATGHRKIQAVTFSPDGKFLATAGDDQQIRLWNTATGQPHGNAFKAPQAAAVLSLAFSPDGKILVSGAGDNRVHLWDAVARKHHATLMEHKGPVTVAAFAPDGKTFATGGQDGSIKLWDLAARKPRATLDGHPGGVTALVFDPRDSGWLASAGNDKIVRLWDLLKLSHHTNEGALAGVASRSADEPPLEPEEILGWLGRVTTAEIGEEHELGSP